MRPTPPSFFWDADEQAFDMSAYLNQRPLQVPRGRVNSWNEYEYPFSIHVGPTEFRVRTASTTVTNLPNLSPTVSMDIGWYRDNDPPTNVNPFTLNRSGGPSFKANVYMWPADRVGEMVPHPKIASIPLRDVPPTQGTVQSVDLPLSASVRAMFYNPSSGLYVNPATHGNTRAYHVAYCLESSALDGSNRLANQYFSRGNFTDRSEITSNDFEWRITLNHRDQFGRIDPRGGLIGMYTRGQRSGCAIANTPVMITVDRLNRSQLPVGNSEFAGQQANRSAGDSRMSGSNDTDSERTCDLDGDGTQDTTGQQCRETQTGGSMGAGNLGRTYYNYDLDLTRMNQSAQAAMTGNVLGFMAIDPMMSGNSGSASPTVGSESSPVTITVTPPWDQIRNTLNGSTMMPPGARLKQEWRTTTTAGNQRSGPRDRLRAGDQHRPDPREDHIRGLGGVGARCDAFHAGRTREWGGLSVSRRNLQLCSNRRVPGDADRRGSRLLSAWGTARRTLRCDRSPGLSHRRGRTQWLALLGGCAGGIRTPQHAVSRVRIQREPVCGADANLVSVAFERRAARERGRSTDRVV